VTSARVVDVMDATLQFLDKCLNCLVPPPSNTKLGALVRRAYSALTKSQSRRGVEDLIQAYGREDSANLLNLCGFTAECYLKEGMRNKLKRESDLQLLERLVGDHVSRAQARMA
jgi:hypothetical protein